MQVTNISASLPSVTSDSRSSTQSKAKPTATSAPHADPSTSAPAKVSSARSAHEAVPTQTAQTQAASSAATALLSQTYSTSVGGKSYSGSIQHSGGRYEISVPNLPGATASGSSLQAAENALNVKIDILA